MKVKEKRKVRGYKVTDTHYSKAMKRCKREKGALSKLVECVVIAYANGLSIKAHKKLENGESALDIFSTIEGQDPKFIQLHN